MRDLYEILGVSHDADTQAIRRAFRTKAKTVHPDSGGGKEEYQDLALAKEILTDPDRRAHYDQTGRDKGIKESSVVQAARDILSQVLGEMIKAPSGGVDDVATVDIIAGMRTLLTHPLLQRRHELAQGKAGLAQAEKRLKRMQGRFKRKDKGENLFEMLICGHLSQIQQSREGIARAEEELEPHELALKMLDNYDYEVEGFGFYQPVQTFQVNFFGSSTTNVSA